MRVATTTRSAMLFTAVALIPGLALGCSSRNANPDTTVASSMGASTGAMASSAGATAGATTSTSAGEVAPESDISTMSDNNIVANVSTANESEISAGRMAEKKGTSSAVRDLGKMLVTDHTKALSDLKTVEKSQKLPSKTLAADTSAKAGKDFMQTLTSTPKGAGWDSTFVQGEIQDHQQDIANTQAMQSQAQNAQLKQALGNSIPTLQKHLQTAQDALTKIGSDTTAAKKY